MWIKALVALALVTVITAAWASYNRAIAKAAELEQQNTELRQGIQEAGKATEEAIAELNRVQDILKNQQVETEIIHKTEIKTVEVIKEVPVETEADACLDTPMPAAVQRLFNPATHDNPAG